VKEMQLTDAVNKYAKVFT